MIAEHNIVILSNSSWTFLYKKKIIDNLYDLIAVMFIVYY